MESAVEAFDEVFSIRPGAYVFADDVPGAGQIFSRSASQSESRFGMPATEERIWRYACQLK